MCCLAVVATVAVLVLSATRLRMLVLTDAEDSAVPADVRFHPGAL